MPHIPTTASVGTMEAKEFKEAEQDNKMPLAGEHHDITGVEKDARIESDEAGSCTLGVDCKFNHPLREGDHEIEIIASSENAGQECKGGYSRFEGGEHIRYTRDQLLQFCEVVEVPKDILKVKREIDAELHGEDQSWGGSDANMATSSLHPPEIKICEYSQELANKDSTYEFNGGMKSRQFDEYPQRPSEPECQYFMKTGYCKFKSACRWHHPKSNLSFPATPLKPMAKSPFHHPPEIKKNERGQESANKDAAYEINGGVKPQLFDEYPQRPGEPECRYFMKTGFCKFKSACRWHHPKSILSFPAPPLKPEDKPICPYYSRHGICKFGSACKYSHHLEHT